MMGSLRLTCALALSVVLCAKSGWAQEASIPEAKRVEALQERLQSQPETQDAIQALQADPDFQAVLNDPDVAAALKSGNTAALLANPKVNDLVNHPAVKDITRQLGR